MRASYPLCTPHILFFYITFYSSQSFRIQCIINYTEKINRTGQYQTYDPCAVSVHEEVLNQSSDSNHFKASVNTIVGIRLNKIWFFPESSYSDFQALLLIKKQSILFYTNMNKILEFEQIIQTEENLTCLSAWYFSYAFYSCV